MSKTPFKMRGWSPFTKKSPAKDDPHTTTETHEAHDVEVKETEEVDTFAYEKELEKQDPKTLTREQKVILSKYPGRKKKAEGN